MASFTLISRPWITLLLLTATLICRSAAFQSTPPLVDPLQQHYLDAGNFLAAGDDQRAAVEYKAFLAEALGRVANARTAAGEFAKAVPQFEEALRFASHDPNLYLDYAKAAFRSREFLEARHLAQAAVREAPKNAGAQLLLGQVLFQLGDYQASKVQLQSVFAANPDSNTGYLLGTNYLLLQEKKEARALFDNMLRRGGNTAALHVLFGQAYSQSGNSEEALVEFRKALALDSKALRTHSQIGLAYLKENEAAGYNKAIQEFQTELRLNPSDFTSHYTLGYIATKQRNWLEAEKELLQASALNPSDRQTLLDLADTYISTNRPKDAETSLRKVLDLSKNFPPDHWTERGHYLLGRILLMQGGHAEEARQELKIVAEIQRQLGPASARMADDKALGAEGPALRETLLGKRTPSQPLAEFLQQISVPIALAYNNLGVIAGNAQDFSSAWQYFRKTQEWNASHPGIDRNLGMAAFYAHENREAVEPLRSHLAAQPADTAARAALGFCLFNLQDFGGAVEALRPMQEQMTQTPKLAYVYAASLARSGAYDEGIARLKSLETANPNASDIHYELSMAYRKQSRTEDADREMKIFEELKKQGPGQTQINK